MSITADQVISTILKHDRKINSYKIALLRAINDVVLAYPDAATGSRDVAIPLHLLAQRWIAYYWPFVDAAVPVWQGPRAKDPRTGQLRNDISFRPQLTTLRQTWEGAIGERAKASDGFILVNDLRLPRKRSTYPDTLQQTYAATVKAASRATEYPIRYAGPGEWAVFDRPKPYQQLDAHLVTAVPGTRLKDKCLVVAFDLWQTFQQLSLWVEALCIHEWSLFTETANDAAAITRGLAYTLLTDQPGSRRPLTWERNRIDLLIMEGAQFTCPWTEKPIRQGVAYDLDHLLPLAIYPTNELWNLVPSDPRFNSHTKRDRLPTRQRIETAQPHLAHAYALYGEHQELDVALREDVSLRFAEVGEQLKEYPYAVSVAVTGFLAQIAESRNVANF